MITLDMEAVTREYALGDSLPVLGRRYGVDTETIRRRLIKAGVARRPVAEATKLSHNARGDFAGLANELGITEQEAREMMLRHDFLRDPVVHPHCVFCTRVRAGDYDPSLSDASAVVFEPLNPVTPGHLLVVPRIHVQDALADPDVTAATMRLAAQVATKRSREMGEDVGWNIITSAGHLATQTVYHLHVHLVPRRHDDGLALPWTGQTRTEENR